MKLLLDQGLLRTTVKHLANAGIVAEHVGDLGMARVADDVILGAARQRDAVVVALDADFQSNAGRFTCDFAIGGADSY